jgi:cytochrome c heme-lyase
VIDFYSGRSALAGVPAFYLDVRPALDGWEGVRMRAEHFWQRWFGGAPMDQSAQAVKTAA